MAGPEPIKGEVAIAEKPSPFPHEVIEGAIDILKSEARFWELAERDRLPCPFCGSNDIKAGVHTRDPDTDSPYNIYSIQCRSCGCSNSKDNPDEVFEWWNTRQSYLSETDRQKILSMQALIKQETQDLSNLISEAKKSSIVAQQQIQSAIELLPSEGIIQSAIEMLPSEGIIQSAIEMLPSEGITPFNPLNAADNLNTQPPDRLDNATCPICGSKIVSFAVFGRMPFICDRGHSFFRPEEAAK